LDEDIGLTMQDFGFGGDLFAGCVRWSTERWVWYECCVGKKSG
jgi:hypothetical protein